MVVNSYFPFMSQTHVSAPPPKKHGYLPIPEIACINICFYMYSTLPNNRGFMIAKFNHAY